MNAWLRNLVWNWKKHWFEWFHIVYASIVIISAFSDIWPDDPSARETLLLVAFLIYFVVLLIFLIVFTFKFSRKARYSEATKCLHSALHSARDAYHYLDWCKSADHNEVLFDEEKLCTYMNTALTSISEAFSLVSAVRCRCSLKVLGQNAENQLYVITLARDEVSRAACEKRDQLESKQHLVNDNTDFLLIAERNLDYFFEGDLANYPNYLNTSTDLHEGLRGKRWSLPYKSTVVLPIRYVYKRHEIQDGVGTNEDLYGFLTVDSSSKNAFIESYDIQMGAALADALFPVLNAYVGLKA